MTDIKLIRLSDVMKKTGFKKSWIYLLISQGDFPPAVKIGSRSVAWLESEVNEWIAGRIGKREVVQQAWKLNDE
ncbi:helix-turn-helix transcriptional regulator [Erwinia mallotivora]|uniref:Dipicolinate synthase n=1 Tax=Erwinia mallotivora TaxID=69222 RepID=A0A014M0Y9_9GAMM|nr:AlpA family transcriptional regulator [Erwinia mallotivora]EXU75506.1 dipicolinate synthase [Erwinia mallotivora]